MQEGFDIGTCSVWMLNTSKQSAGYEQGMQEGIAWGTCQGVLEMFKALKSQMDDQVLSQKVQDLIHHLSFTNTSC